MTPESRPQVETEKSKYAVESKVALAMAASFRFGLSSMSRIVGHVLASTLVAASLDFKSLMMLCIERITEDFETSTIIRTVGSVVRRF